MRATARAEKRPLGGRNVHVRTSRGIKSPAFEFNLILSRPARHGESNFPCISRGDAAWSIAEGYEEATPDTPSRSANWTTLAKLRESATLRESGKMQREKKRENDNYRHGQKEVSILPPISRGKFVGRVGRTHRPSFFKREKKRERERERGNARWPPVPRALLSRSNASVAARNVPLLAAEEGGRVSVTRARQMGVARVQERGERGRDLSVAGNPEGGRGTPAHFFRLSGIHRHNWPTARSFLSLSPPARI